MNVSKIFNLSFKSAKPSVNNYRTKPYPADSFTKTSFKGNVQENDFIKWANKNGFSDNLEQALNPRNKLGSGFSHTVYNIENNSDYVLRTPTYFDNKAYDLSKAEIIDDEDKNLDINIGQPVAKIKIPQKGIDGIFVDFEILKKQKGESIGVPPAEVLAQKPDAAPYEAKERKEHYAKMLSKLASAPQESYDTLIKEYQKATKAGYKFDYLNSNNVLFDDENQKFNFIDMEKGEASERYDALLYAISNISYFNTYTGEYPKEFEVSTEEKQQAQNDTAAVIKKFTSAMQKAGVKFDKNDITYEFNTCLSTMPFMLFALKETRNIDVWQAFERLGVA